MPKYRVHQPSNIEAIVCILNFKDWYKVFTTWYTTLYQQGIYSILVAYTYIAMY